MSDSNLTTPLVDIDQILVDILNQLDPHGLTITQLLELYGKLGMALGASIANLTSIPPMDTLQKEYYARPTVDIALILQGYTILSWIESFLQDPKRSSLSLEKEKEENV